MREKGWARIPRLGFSPNRLSQFCGVAACYFGTLKMASRIFPQFTVAINVAEKMRLRPRVAANFHPRLPLSRSPLRAFCPRIVIKVAMRIAPLNGRFFENRKWELSSGDPAYEGQFSTRRTRCLTTLALRTAGSGAR